MPLELLDSRRERQLLSIVSAVLEKTAAGVSPTAALLEQAKQADLGPEFVRRLAEAINVRRTTDILKAAGDRDREIELADAGEVIRQLYSPPARKAASNVTAYAPPDFRTMASRAELRKAASVSTQKPDAVGSVDLSRGYQLMRSAARQLDVRREKLAAAKHRLFIKLSDLRTYFRSHPERFEEVDARAEAVLGKPARRLMGIVYSGETLKRAGAKRAPASFKHAAANLDDKPYNLLKQAMDTAVELHDAVRQWSLPVGRLAKAKRLLDGVRKSASNKFMDWLVGVLPSSVEEAAKRVPAGTPILPPEITAPQIAAEERSIRASEIINDLLRTDEVLSEVDPEDVVRAYNELVQTAPDILDQPAALRSGLRRALAQRVLEPFELSSLATVSQQRQQSDQARLRNAQLGAEISTVI